MSSFALWQGWGMRWQYNHRLNRTGSLLEQLPCRESTGPRLRCRARIVSTAASGTGTDQAELDSFYALVAARGVQAASAAKEVLLQGAEGDALTSRTEVFVPLAAGAAELPLQLGLLSGFDAAALGSADKLERFSIEVEEPRVSEEGARVGILIEGRFDCSSTECPGVEEVNMSILVGVTVLSARSEALKTIVAELAHAYEWDSKDEMPRERALARVPTPATSGAAVWGIRGFSVAVDSEMHLAELGMHIGDTTRDETAVTLMVRNWRHRMKGARPPMSWFAYKQSGRAEWSASLLRLGFMSGTVDLRSWTTSLAWAGRGTPALAPEGERFRMVEWEVAP